MIDKVYGGIETGGTKFVCAIGTAPDNLIKTQFATTSPDESIGKAIDFFKNYSRQKQLTAINVLFCHLAGGFDSPHQININQMYK